MTKPKVSIQFWSALAMLVGGYALAVAGFIVPPKGEISDSVLWIFSQCLIYAGSIFGVSIYYGRKVHQLSCEVREEMQAALERSSEPKPIMAKQFEGKIMQTLDKAIKEEEQKLNSQPQKLTQAQP